MAGITTSGGSQAQFGRTFLGRFSFGARMGKSSGQTGPILIGLRLRWRYRCLYLRTFWQEFCNVYHRMELLRKRHLCQTGTSLLSSSELAALSRRDRSNLLRARIHGIQRLQTILPTATLVDLHLIVESYPSHLFVEGWNTAVRSRRDTRT